MEVIRKDVVVVGLGAFGSAALWRLARLGVDVAGIERQGIGHHLGSSHGVTRLFRIACQEHPGLAPIALKSLELWTGPARGSARSSPACPWPPAGHPFSGSGLRILARPTSPSTGFPPLSGSVPAGKPCGATDAPSSTEPRSEWTREWADAAPG